MKISRFVFLIIVLIILSSCTKYYNSDFPLLRGPYLGQNQPTDIPELFAPEIVSSKYNEHSGIIFTPDGNEAFWSREINLGKQPRIIVIMHMEQHKGKWTNPKLAPFNFNNALYNHVNSISPDGQRLYFYTFNDKDGSQVWLVNKTENGWGEPSLIKLITEDNPGTSVNEVHEARNKNIYCMGPLGISLNGRGIVRSRFVNGKHDKYESIGADINYQFDDPYPNHSPTVDPDERYVIFVSRRPGGFGTQDLYISYCQPNGYYGDAINLGVKINSIGSGNSWPQISPDGKFLFFVSYAKPFNENEYFNKNLNYKDLIQRDESIKNGLGNIYWVNTSFIQELKDL